MTLDTQFLTMISMVVGGIYLGFANDTYRRLIDRRKITTIFLYFLEVSFWLIQTAILFYVLYQVNYGEIRFYIFLAILLGISMYVVMFQTLYQRILEIIIEIIKQIIYLIIRTIDTLIISPIKWVISLIVTIVTYTIYFIIKIVSFFLRVLFYPVKLFINLLEKLLPEKVLKNVTKILKFCSTILYKFKSRVKKLFAKRR